MLHGKHGINAESQKAKRSLIHELAKKLDHELLRARKSACAACNGSGVVAGPGRCWLC